jgi:hypothetical protein
MTNPLSEGDIQALVGRAEAERQEMPSPTVLIDAEALPQMPPDREQRPYEWARDTVGVAQDQARARLIALRAQRDDINAEIKLLVDEVDLLDRMYAIAKKRDAQSG